MRGEKHSGIRNDFVDVEITRFISEKNFTSLNSIIIISTLHRPKNQILPSQIEPAATDSKFLINLQSSFLL